jgi:signal transduction histidine kinase
MDVTDRVRAREALQVFSRQLLEAHESERRHMARELHDEIGQQLTALMLLLDPSAHGSPEALGRSLDGARTLTRELLARVRNLSLDLRPSTLDDLGLLPALLSHFERYAGVTGVKVSFTHAGLDGRRFEPEIETAAYRIVQEALTNVARHSSAHDVSVHVTAGETVLVLEIEDRGSGFDPAAALNAASSSGLLGMRERAKLLHGQLSVESAPGAGTRLRGELPL